MSECASDACEKMCPLIASLEQFQANQAKLQSIYKDTLSLVESNQSLELPENFAGSLDADQLQNILDKNKNSVHILGESYATKCRCLNWMLCENILPTHCEKWLQKRHQVVVKHGANHQLAVTLPDNYLIPVDKVFSCSDDIREYLTGTSTISEAIGDGTVGDLLADVNSNVYGIEVLMGKSILSYGLQVTLHYSSGSTGLSESSNTINDGTIPLFICAMDGDNSNNNAQLLQTLKRISPTVPVLLWFDSDVSNKCLKRKLGHLNNSYNGKTLLCVKTQRNAANSTNNLSSCLDNGDTTHTTNSLWNIEKLLQEMQYDVICAKKWTDIASDNTGCEHLALYCDHLDLSHTCNVCQVAPMFTALIRSALKYFLANASTVQNSLHHDMLESTISKVYSLSRDVLITPKRIEYAQCQERLLYKRLLDIATHNQLDIMDIISSVKVECAERIMQLTESYDAEVDINGVKRPTTILSAAKNIQNFVLQHVKLAAAEKLNNNINVLRDSVTGTLSRCLMHLETFDEDGIDSFVSEEASQHLKMILNAAYNVEINVHSSSSLLSIVLDKIRQMFYSLSWRDTKTLDSAWKCKVAEGVLDNLCESRLAKHMCSQFRTQLSEAHEHFVSSLQHLQQRVQGRLDKEEAKKHHASKILAPQIAQLALRSRSLIDELQYGMPKMGKELGRGMYGVVFACSPWGKSPKGPKRCAVKSVVPHDEKHWNDLALEFHYSISLPPHPRIVELYGSVIDHSYGGGSDQAVLLVMERMNRDLHCAIKRGLSELVRMSIGIDVIEGIRYLHSQGLVHRDIKLKNILLDGNNRAKISDLGFCKPSAMMSGSIVGTPIHMPPELFSGQYDNSVDVYAFGVLFWHLCAASVHIPIHYRNCVSKDHLWTAVRKGTRPEYLTCFRDDCWVIMTECWHQDATKRPLPGILHEKLIRIHHKLVVT